MACTTVPGDPRCGKAFRQDINDRCLPDKAIDVIDEIGAAVKIQLRINGARASAPRRRKDGCQDRQDPARSVSSSDKEQLQTLERDLKLVVFGQDPAIDMLASTIKLSRSGLGHPEKPIGCFLFAGPTGVGKTELAKQLAKTMGIEFLRFDMSEYMEKHTVSRLIGAPPGYVASTRRVADRCDQQQSVCGAIAR